MKELLRCLFGLHKYEVLDIKEVTDERNEIVGYMYVNRCISCGHIKTKFVPVKINAIRI